MSNSRVNLIKDENTKTFETNWLQTIRRLLPGVNTSSLTEEQYKQSLILVIDSSTDYIPFSEIFEEGQPHGPTLAPAILPIIMWIFIFIFIEASIWKKIGVFSIYLILLVSAANSVLSGYVDTILGGDMERPFSYLRPTVTAVPGVGVQRFNHKDFLAIKSSPTIMYLTSNNWIKNIKGDIGFLVPATAFFKAAREAKIEARDLSELTSNFLSNDAVETSVVRKNAGTSVNDQFDKRSLALSRMGFFMAYSMIVWITFTHPQLYEVTGSLVRSILAILVSMSVLIFDIIKITPAAINRTLIVKRNILFLAYSCCLLALL
tara:strand:+ start:137 stop:1093 length:957 start_codon:yes stop_codon:yes gene_type:complete